MRRLNLLIKKCSICGEKCNDIGDKTSEDVVKEWCCNCTMKRIGLVTYCEKCL